MDKQSIQYKQFKNGILAGVPIMIGYLPIAVAFGMLSKTTGISILECFMFSAIVFAGASQFMALNMIAIGSGTVEIVLATLLINFRHFLMSASLAVKIKEEIKKYVPFIAYGITDEFFSVMSLREGESSKEFMIALESSAYLAWVGGSVLGYAVGGILPPSLANSMPIALYAMFIALVTPAMKKSFHIVVLVLTSGALNAILNYFKVLPSGWNMIAAILISSFLGVYFMKEEDEKNE